MEFKSIFFVGLGGAGQRHLRIFKERLPLETQFSAFRATKKTPLLNSDFSVNQEITVQQKFDLTLFNSLEEAFNSKPDLIVISTPSSLHYDVALQAAKQSIHVFIEKPFSHNLDGFSDFSQFILENELIFFVSFQRRFHPYMRKIKELLEIGKLGKIISAHFDVCSYVPEWHKYENFRELYACRQDLGGGVLLTEIHELDLCAWYFGLPDLVYCAGGNFSDVNLDIEDTAHMTLKYQDFNVQVDLCFMQQHNRRELYIAGTKGYVEWNMEGNQFLFHDYETNEKEAITDSNLSNDDPFLAQATDFLSRTSSESPNELTKAQNSLLIVEAAKQSMKTGAEIKIKTVI